MRSIKVRHSRMINNESAIAGMLYWIPVSPKSSFPLSRE